MSAAQSVLVVAAAFASSCAVAPAPASAPAATVSAASDEHDDAACIRCHAREAEAWRRSAHARARTTPAFVESLRTAAFPRWCLSCHAAGAGGVGCVQCHAEHAKPARDACDRCHEFAQPRRDEQTNAHRFVLGPLPAQSTVSEGASSFSVRAGASCADCHMSGGDHASPSLRGTGIAVTLIDVDDARARFRVDLRAVGHRVPTGDPFRRIEIDLCADAECSELAGKRVFERVTREEPEGFAVVDDRTFAPPAAAPSSSTLVAVKLHAVPVRWRAVEKLVEERLEGRVPADVSVFTIGGGAIGR